MVCYVDFPLFGKWDNFLENRRTFSPIFQKVENRYSTLFEAESQRGSPGCNRLLIRGLGNELGRFQTRRDFLAPDLVIAVAHCPGLSSINGGNQAIRAAIPLRKGDIFFHFLENETTFWKIGQLFGK